MEVLWPLRASIQRGERGRPRYMPQKLLSPARSRLLTPPLLRDAEAFGQKCVAQTNAPPFCSSRRKDVLRCLSSGKVRSNVYCLTRRLARVRERGPGIYSVFFGAPSPPRATPSPCPCVLLFLAQGSDVNVTELKISRSRYECRGWRGPEAPLSKFHRGSPARSAATSSA